MNRESQIREVCDEICTLLIDKNRKYGDSALSPISIFSKARTDEQIRVRLDDKLSRLKSAQLDDDEDVILDLMGYLILLRVWQKENASVNEDNERFREVMKLIDEFPERPPSPINPPTITTS